LLILGGSQGSQHLNAAVTAMVGQSPLQFTGWHIVHQTGSEQQEMVREEYVRLGVTATVAAFFDDMAERYAQATLAICRAGATTLAELACAGCPAILVPFPHAADNHQLRNAQAFRDAGAALLAEQGGDATETGRRLADGVQQVLREEGPLTRMSHAMQALSRPDAAQKVVAELQSLARGM
jgi:UDP-N-acetylglucosamine--N-acetylmuramyl-(pentapeptide) pyrophosphoryl-undecaprenol N-acetylglucosamine transferase